MSRNIFSESKLIAILTKNVFDTLTITLLCILLTWYAQYHWKRRKLYQIAAQRKGPLNLPFIGSALYFLGSTNDIFNKMLRLTNEFESPVRMWLGQQLFFVVSEPDDLEIIMNSPHTLEKGDQMYKFSKTMLGSGLVTAPVPKWKRHRKIIVPTFNQKILDEFMEVFTEQSEILLKQLKREVGNGTFDIDHYVCRCVLDILCETAMGTTVNAQTTESYYFQWLYKFIDATASRIRNVAYHPDFIFNRTSIASELYDVIKKINKFTSAVVTEKRKDYQQKLQENMDQPEILCGEEPHKRKPFLQLLIELTEEGTNFTDKDLLDEVNTLMSGGTHTTATTSSFVFVMLGMFPDVQDKVYEEIIDVLGPDRPVESKDLKNLQYLERVIKETMRLFPAGPLISRDVTGDIKLGKCTLPAGSSVIGSIMNLQRDPKVWPNPLNFDPERFLPEEVAKRHPYSWLAFSGGPRNCIGIKFAMMTMKTLIATVIRKYRIFTDYKSIEELKLKLYIFLKPQEGYRVSIEARE